MRFQVRLMILGLTSLFAVTGAGLLSVKAEQVSSHGYQMQEIIYGDSVSGTTQTYRFGYSDELFADNAQSGTLAKASMAAAAKAYGSAEEVAEFTVQLGFTVLKQVNYDRIATQEDCDFVAYTIASKQVVYGEAEYTLYGVFIRGTAGNAEWYSNFNVGQEGDHYGFTTATEEVYASLAEVVDPQTDHKIWITGHSRGGAVSNLLAARLNEEGTLVREENLVAYTFACPATTVQPVAYPNIYNYNVSGDVIAAMPLKAWDFSVHGVTRVLTPSADAASLYQERTGNAYAGAETTDAFSQAMQTWCPTRSDYDAVNALGTSPHKLIDKIAPALMGESIDFTSILLDVLGNLNATAAVQYFASNLTGITQAHSPAAYLSFLDVLYPHEHVFDYVSDGNATCMEDGTLTGTCYCGEVVTGVIEEGSALGHTFHRETTSDGSILYICEVCGETVRYKDINYATVSEPEAYEYWGEPIIPQIEVHFMDELLLEGLDYSLIITNNNAVGTAQVIIKGEGEYTGSRVINFSIVEHVHTFGDYVSDGNATCTQDGTKTAHCLDPRCSATDTVTDEGSALGHDYRETQNEQGVSVFTCAHCGDTVVGRDLSYAVVQPIPDQEYRGEPIKPAVNISFLGETLVEGVDYTLLYYEYDAVGEAYVVVKGEGKYENSSITVNFQIIEHKHVFGTYLPDGNATCTEDGTKTAHCIGCGEADTLPDVGSKLGHDYVSDGVQFGIETFCCTRCGDSYRIRLLSAAAVAVDDQLILDGKSASEAVSLTFMGTPLEEGVDYVLSSSYRMEGENIHLILTCRGVGEYTGSLVYDYLVVPPEETPDPPVDPPDLPVDPPVDPPIDPPDQPFDWLAFGVSCGGVVVAGGAIALAVFLGIKRRGK